MNDQDREAFEAWADNLPSGHELHEVEKSTAMFAWQAALAHRDAHLAALAAAEQGEEAGN